METERTPSPAQIRVAFLGMINVDKGIGYRGGILLTDSSGKPVEFRCTAPVRPNPLQKTLYGQTLLPHIAAELIGLPLIKSLQEKPSLIIIQDSLFFDVRLHSHTPIVRVWRQGEQVRIESGNDPQRTNAILSCMTGKFQPVILESHWKFRADSEIAIQQLTEMFAEWDIIEPFDRLNRALEYVHEQKLLET